MEAKLSIALVSTVVAISFTLMVWSYFEIMKTKRKTEKYKKLLNSVRNPLDITREK